MNDRKPLFDDDEMELMQVDPTWTQDDLLAQEGIFFLKDIVKKLGVDALKVKKHARIFRDKGRDAYAVMGARKIWNHWIIRMTTFAPYFREHLIPRIKTVNPNWTGNVLLKQTGLFLLTDVCAKIPFSANQLRHQAKRNPNSRQEYGIWKDEELNLFVVDMEPFAKWITQLWDDGQKENQG